MADPLRLPCGCRTEPTHHSGDRLVVCKGGHYYTECEPCPGGRGYVIRGTLAVTYAITPWSKP